MKKANVILVFCAMIIFLFIGAIVPNEKAQNYLSFSLHMSMNSSPVSFAIIKMNQGKVIQKTYITKQMFMLIASGEEYSVANPDSANLFESFMITHCGIEKDTVQKKLIYDFGTVNDIWKLRYREYPFGSYPDNEGWSQGKMVPSDGQQKILQQYGINYFQEFIIGDNAFKLLRDMENPSWVAQFKNS